MRTLNPQYLKAVARQVNACPFFRLISMEILDLEWGRSRLAVKVRNDHLQPFGMVHGGVFSSLIDAAAFWAVYPCLDEEDGMTTVELKLNYLSPAAGGRLEAEGRTVKKGRTLSLAEASVTDGDARLLAHGTVTLMRISGLRLQESPPLPSKFLPDES